MSFKSWNSYWDFSDSVRNKNRYIFDRESQEFLDSLLETSKDRIRTIEKGGVLWRSQNGHSHKPLCSGEIHISDEPTASPPNRMKPLAYNASDGRANPKGIPYLYVATTKDTAMAEVRPWLGSIISTAQFKVTRDLRIVEFYTENGNERHF